MECFGEGYLVPKWNKKKNFSFERFLERSTYILLFIVLFLLVIVMFILFFSLCVALLS